MRFTGSYIVTVVSCDIGFPVFISYCLLLAVYFYELDFGCLTITRYLRDLDHKIPSVNTAQKMFPADLVTFTEEILNGKLHFFAHWTLWNIFEGLGQNPNAPTNYSATLVHISLIPRYPTDNFWPPIAITINMDLIFHAYKVFLKTNWHELLRFTVTLAFL